MRILDPSRLRTGGPVVAAIVLIVVASLSVSGFATWANVKDIGTQNAVLGIVAAGVTLVIVGGNFDLSIGSVYALCGVVYAILAGKMPLLAAALIAVAIGAGVGLVNAILVTKVGLNSFIATLGTSSVVSGLAYYVSNNQATFVTKPGFGTLGNGSWLGVPIPIWIMAFVMTGIGLLLSRTVFGLELRAAGANRVGASIVGIRVGLVQTASFVLVGACAGLAALIADSQLSSAQANVGTSLALDAIAVVVIGGTSLWGGSGSVQRTVVGLIVLAVLLNSFDQLGVSSSLQLVIQGAVVVLAVASDAIGRKSRGRRG